MNTRIPSISLTQGSLPQHALKIGMPDKSIPHHESAPRSLSFSEFNHGSDLYFSGQGQGAAPVRLLWPLFALLLAFGYNSATPVRAASGQTSSPLPISYSIPAQVDPLQSPGGDGDICIPDNLVVNSAADLNFLTTAQGQFVFDLCDQPFLTPEQRAQAEQWIARLNEHQKGQAALVIAPDAIPQGKDFYDLTVAVYNHLNLGYGSANNGVLVMGNQARLTQRLGESGKLAVVPGDQVAQYISFEDTQAFLQDRRFNGMSVAELIQQGRSQEAVMHTLDWAESQLLELAPRRGPDGQIIAPTPNPTAQGGALPTAVPGVSPAQEGSPLPFPITPQTVGIIVAMVLGLAALGAGGVQAHRFVQSTNETRAQLNGLLTDLDSRYRLDHWWEVYRPETLDLLADPYGATGRVDPQDYIQLFEQVEQHPLMPWTIKDRAHGWHLYPSMPDSVGVTYQDQALWPVISKKGVRHGVPSLRQYFMERLAERYETEAVYPILKDGFIVETDPNVLKRLSELVADTAQISQIQNEIAPFLLSDSSDKRRAVVQIIGARYGEAPDWAASTLMDRYAEEDDTSVSKAIERVIAESTRGRDQDALFIGLLDHEKPIVRTLAIRSLGQSSDKDESFSALWKAFPDEPEQSFTPFYADALTRQFTEPKRSEVHGALDTLRVAQKAQDMALTIISKYPSNVSLKPLFTYLFSVSQSQITPQAKNTIDTLLKCVDESTRPTLLAELQSTNSVVRRAAARGLAKTANYRDLEPLVNAIRQESSLPAILDYRHAVLACGHHEEAIEDLEHWLTDSTENMNVRVATVDALAQHGAPVLGTLMDTLGTIPESGKNALYEPLDTAIQRIRLQEESYEPLVARMTHPHRRVAELATGGVLLWIQRNREKAPYFSITMDRFRDLSASNIGQVRQDAIKAVAATKQRHGELLKGWGKNGDVFATMTYDALKKAAVEAPDEDIRELGAAQLEAYLQRKETAVQQLGTSGDMYQANTYTQLLSLSQLDPEERIKREANEALEALQKRKEVAIVTFSTVDVTRENAYDDAYGKLKILAEDPDPKIKKQAAPVKEKVYDARSRYVALEDIKDLSDTRVSNDGDYRQAIEKLKAYERHKAEDVRREAKELRETLEDKRREHEVQEALSDISSLGNTSVSSDWSYRDAKYKLQNYLSFGDSRVRTAASMAMGSLDRRRDQYEEANKPSTSSGGFNNDNDSTPKATGTGGGYL